MAPGVRACEGWKGPGRAPAAFWGGGSRGGGSPSQPPFSLQKAAPCPAAAPSRCRRGAPRDGPGGRRRPGALGWVPPAPPVPARAGLSRGGRALTPPQFLFSPRGRGAGAGGSRGPGRNWGRWERCGCPQSASPGRRGLPAVLSLLSRARGGAHGHRHHLGPVVGPARLRFVVVAPAPFCGAGKKRFWVPESIKFGSGQRAGPSRGGRGARGRFTGLPQGPNRCHRGTAAPGCAPCHGWHRGLTEPSGGTGTATRGRGVKARGLLPAHARAPVRGQPVPGSPRGEGAGAAPVCAGPGPRDRPGPGRGGPGL